MVAIVFIGLCGLAALIAIFGFRKRLRSQLDGLTSSSDYGSQELKDDSEDSEADDAGLVGSSTAFDDQQVEMMDVSLDVSTK